MEGNNKNVMNKVMNKEKQVVASRSMLYSGMLMEKYGISNGACVRLEKDEFIDAYNDGSLLEKLSPSLCIEWEKKEVTLDNIALVVDVRECNFKGTEIKYLHLYALLFGMVEDRMDFMKPKRKSMSDTEMETEEECGLRLLNISKKIINANFKF